MKFLMRNFIQNEQKGQPQGFAPTRNNKKEKEKL